MGHSLKCCELWHHVSGIEANEGTLVAHLVTVVWRTEHCDTVAIVLHLIAIRLCLQQLWISLVNSLTKYQILQILQICMEGMKASGGDSNLLK